MNGPSEVLALLIPVLIVAVVFGFVTIVVYLRHREKMAMIEKGLTPADVERNEREGPEAALRGGLITSLVGLALLLGLLTLGIGPWLLGGLIPMFVGVARIIGYLLTADRSVRKGGGVE